MADTIRIKRRNTGAAGPPSALANAELAFNEVDQKLYYGSGNVSGQASSIVSVGGTNWAALTSPAFTGTPTTPTPAVTDNSTTVANTAYVRNSSVAKAGDSMSGALTINVAGAAAAYQLYKDSGQAAYLMSFSRSNNQPRWQLLLGSASAETGVSNAGSDFIIRRYTDAGVANGDMVNISRSTGTVTIDAANLVGTTANPVSITPPVGTINTQIATTAFCANGFAPIASAALTGSPTSTTPPVGDNSTRIATTAFCAVNYAPLNTPAFTGIPTAPTASVGTNTPQLATCQFVAASMSSGASSGNRVLISKQTVSTAVASVQFLGATGFNNSVYDEYELTWFDLQFGSESAPCLRYSVDGSTFDGSGDYIHYFVGWGSTNAQTGQGAATTYLQIGNSVGISTYQTGMGRARIRTNSGGSSPRTAHWFNYTCHNSSGAFAGSGGGQFVLAQIPVGVQFLSAGGYTITRGTFALYGIQR